MRTGATNPPVLLMTWTTETSPPEEVALERAWDAVNQALDRRVRVSIQMRVTACVFDALSFMTLLRELEAGEVARFEKDAPGATAWESQLSFQFAAAFKAMYYFVRALQDAAYAALLEASGRRAGAYSSMQDCVKKTANPIRSLIEQALPNYFAWFTAFRDVRNDMKLGASTAFHFRGGASSKEMRVILQKVDDAKRYVSHGRELSLVDMEECLMHSAQLLQFVADYVGQLSRQ
jgi:hypothetical protein